MVIYGTQSLGATGSNAWINTTSVEARLIRGTIRIHGALGTATDVWVAKVIRQARAHATVTFGVGATLS